jgi:hypothetical protein
MYLKSFTVESILVQNLLRISKGLAQGRQIFLMHYPQWKVCNEQSNICSGVQFH